MLLALWSGVCWTQCPPKWWWKDTVGVWGGMRGANVWWWKDISKRNKIKMRVNCNYIWNKMNPNVFSHISHHQLKYPSRCGSNGSMMDRVQWSARSGRIPLTLEWQGAMKGWEQEEKGNWSGWTWKRVIIGNRTRTNDEANGDRPPALTLEVGYNRGLVWYYTHFKYA